MTSCGGRVYRGDTITISVPFNIDEYENLTITYSTIGDNVVVKTQEEVEIEDGFITYTFGEHELDLLPDGVIYYTIACDVNGVPNVDSTNTNFVLKTPAGYSGRTAEDIYQEGYNDGLDACSGETPDCSSAITQAYQEGYEQGLQDCSGETPDCSAAWNDGYSSGTTDGYAEGEVVGKAAGYSSGYTDGYNQGQAECSGDTPCDCSSAITEAYGEGYESGRTDGFSSGYTAGQSDCQGCNLVETRIALTERFTGQAVDTPEVPYDGFSKVTIIDGGFGSTMFQNGYTSGATDGFSSGYSAGYGSGVSACSCVLETKTVELTAITQTIQAGNNARPVAPSGQTVYGGSIEEFENYIQHGNGGWPACYPHLYYYEDVNHTTEIEIGIFLLDTTQWRGYLFWDRVNVANVVYFNEMPKDEWVSACGGNIHFLNDGVNIWFYGDYKYGMTIRDNTYNQQLDINDLLFETVLYDGISAVTVDASAIYNSGYTAGQDSCDCSSAITEAYESGFTAGEGELHTIEVVIQTEYNYYVPFVPSAVPKTTVVLYEGEGASHVQSPYDFSGITEGDGLDDYIGTYYFVTQSPDNSDLYYCSQIYDATAKTLTLCFKGYCMNSATTSPYPVYPPPYTCPSALGLDLVSSNFDEWGDWSVKSVRFNGRPLYDNNGGLSKIGNGGFKLVPTFYRDEVSSRTGYRHIFMTMYS